RTVPPNVVSPAVNSNIHGAFGTSVTCQRPASPLDTCACNPPADVAARNTSTSNTFLIGILSSEWQHGGIPLRICGADLFEHIYFFALQFDRFARVLCEIKKMFFASVPKVFPFAHP